MRENGSLLQNRKSQLRCRYLGGSGDEFRGTHSPAAEATPPAESSRQASLPYWLAGVRGPMYFLAMLTTRRRFASVRCFSDAFASVFACSK